MNTNLKLVTLRDGLSSGGWEYDQPDHQIKSLYVHALCTCRYEKQRKM